MHLCMKKCVGLIQHVFIVGLWKRLGLLPKHGSASKARLVRACTKIRLTNRFTIYTRLLSPSHCHLYLRNLLYQILFGITSILYDLCSKIPEISISHAVTQGLPHPLFSCCSTKNNEV